MKIFLVGSAAEGTIVRLFKEADFCVELKGLEETPFLVKDDATKLYVNPKMDSKFKEDFFDSLEVFNHAKFLLIFEEQFHRLHGALNLAKIKIRWNSSQFVPCSKEFCDDANEDDDMNEFMHCPGKIHCPLITNTKLGPCLVYQFEQFILTADFVPLFPVIFECDNEHSNRVFALQGKVFDTLLSPDPPVNFLAFTKGVLAKDRILPEEFYDMSKTDNIQNKGPIFVALKLLNYNKESYSVVKPFQNIEIAELKVNDNMRIIYTIIKVLTKMLKVEDLISYTIKKVLSLKQYQALLQDGEMSDLTRMKILFQTMQHFDLKKPLQKHIDYKKWEKSYSSESDRLPMR